MPATVLEFLPRGTGKTALQWHHLKRHSHLLGLPILCVGCKRPHATPPTLGKCPCGGYLFGIGSAAQPQLPLSLDFHGGEV